MSAGDVTFVLSYGMMKTIALGDRVLGLRNNGQLAASFNQGMTMDPLSLPMTITVRDIALIAGAFLLFGRSRDGHNVVYVSVDLTNWTLANIEATPSEYGESAIGAAGVSYLFDLDTKNIAYSNDGINWEVFDNYPNFAGFFVSGDVAYMAEYGTGLQIYQVAPYWMNGVAWLPGVYSSRQFVLGQAIGLVAASDGTYNVVPFVDGQLQQPADAVLPGPYLHPWEGVCSTSKVTLMAVSGGLFRYGADTRKWETIIPIDNTFSRVTCRPVADSSGRLYFVTNDGADGPTVFVSSDQGQSWKPLASFPMTLQSDQFPLTLVSTPAGLLVLEDYVRLVDTGAAESGGGGGDGGGEDPDVPVLIPVPAFWTLLLNAYETPGTREGTAPVEDQNYFEEPFEGITTDEWITKQHDVTNKAAFSIQQGGAAEGSAYMLVNVGSGETSFRPPWKPLKDSSMVFRMKYRYDSGAWFEIHDTQGNLLDSTKSWGPPNDWAGYDFMVNGLDGIVVSFQGTGYVQIDSLSGALPF